MRAETAVQLARYALGDATPISADCGELCAAACCKSGDDRRGMLLFPGEERLLRGCTFVRLSYVRYEGFSRPVWFMDCDGRCPRELRPLACRIFPLFPFSKGHGFRIGEDARGRPLCPLTDGNMTHIKESFRRAVGRAAEVLMKSPEIRRFIRELSAQIEETSRFF